jgi:hypothetical protein
MAFKLTYTDGQSSDYDDDTAYEVEHGVLKMGREDGKWTVLVSPSHWAVVELIPSPSKKDDGAKDDSSSDDSSDDSSSDDSKDDDSKDDDSKDDDEKKSDDGD